MTSQEALMENLSVEQRAAAVTVRRMLYAQLTSRALGVAAQLGIPDLLAGQPLGIREISARTGTDTDSLTRLLRSLAVFGVFQERPGQVFALTPMGEALTSGHPSSALHTALLVSGEFGDAWGQLLETVRTGRSPFERIHATSLFAYLETEQARTLRATFDDSQKYGLVLEVDEILHLVDFSPYHTVIDIGGGEGTFLKRILDRFPDTTGMIFDLPGSATLANSQPPEEHLSERCTVVPGNFFEEVPEGGDLYLLSHILHDWCDESAVRILQTCRRAMASQATLMVVDLVAPEDGQADERLHTAALMDLYMLSLFGGTGGQERTAEHVGGLLVKAGFRVAEVHALPSGMHVIRAVPDS
jgi:hypothetical protein